MSVKVTLTVSCPDHPKYSGRNIPRAKQRDADGRTRYLCWACLDIRTLTHPVDNYSFDVEKVEVHNAKS